MDQFIRGGPYADYVMAAVTDDFFRWLTNEQTPTWADGEVDAPTGWFAVVRPEREDLIAYVQEFGDPALSAGRYVKHGNWYVVEIDTLGFVHTYSFDGLDGLRPVPEQQRRAIATFAYYTRHYNTWMDAVEA